MQLYIVRHGKCVPKERNRKKPLSIDGVEETEKIACFIRLHFAVQIKAIYHSRKLRAKETAELFSKFLSPGKGIKAFDFLAPDGDIKKLEPVLNENNDIMIISHIPFIPNLVSDLICGEEKYDILNIPESSVICMSNENEKNQWLIEWLITPGIIQ